MKNNKIHLYVYIAIISIVTLILISSGNSEESSSTSESTNTGFKNEVSFSFNKNEHILTVHSNAIPNHSVGSFPNSHNPNTISPQNLTFNIPTNPVKNPTLDPQDITVQRKVFAVSIEGVFFEPFTEEFYDPSTGRRVQNNPSLLWNFDGLGASNRGENLGMDNNLAHVQPDGTYHYHGLPMVLDTGNATTHSPLIAFAGDGYPLLGKYGLNTDGNITAMKSCWVQKQSRGEASDVPPISKYPMGTFVQDYEYNQNCNDLDKYNGHYGKIPAAVMEKYIQYYDENSYVKNADNTITMYHYHTTENYPYVSRSFIGTPNESFIKQGPSGRSPRRRE